MRLNVGMRDCSHRAIGALMPTRFLTTCWRFWHAWTPMGIYFIASTNPSSLGLHERVRLRGWSMVGHAVVWVAALVPCSVAAALGAVLSCTSREPAFFLFVITVALPRSRCVDVTTLAIVASSHPGISSCARQTSRAPTWRRRGEHRSLGDLLGDNMSFLPQYLAGLRTAGDRMAGRELLTALSRCWPPDRGCRLYRRCAHLVVAQLTDLLTLVGAMAGVPTHSSVFSRSSTTATYQERATLMPLWIVFLFFLRRWIGAGMVAITGCRARRAGGRPSSGRCSSCCCATPWFLRSSLFQSESDGGWWWPGCPHRPEHGLE